MVNHFINLAGYNTTEFFQYLNASGIEPKDWRYQANKIFSITGELRDLYKALVRFPIT